MSKKNGLILIFVLALLVIAAIVYYVFYFSKNKAKEPVQNNTISETTDKSVPEKTEVAVVENKTKVSAPENTVDATKPVGQVELERMAKSFAERFGSFSNQSNFANIKDLKMFMSEKMKKWADAYLANNQKSNTANQVYYGMTTKALSASAESFDSEKGTALIVVETRRREAIGTTNNNSKLYNQKINIVFVKENQAWKVDSALWEE